MTNRDDVLLRAIERLSALQELTDDLIEVALLQEEIDLLLESVEDPVETAEADSRPLDEQKKEGQCTDPPVDGGP